MSAALEGRTVVALASFDSFAKTAMAMLTQCRKHGAKTALHLVEIPGRKLSRRQRLEVQRVDPRSKIHRQPWTEIRPLCKKLIDSCDVILLCLDGQRSKDLCLILEHLAGEELTLPLLVSAYPGILFRYQLEGMLDRSAVDLLCLNGDADLNTYREGCAALGMDANNAVKTGLPILWDLQHRPQVPDNSCFVFFEQPSIPAHPLQRRYICKQLQRLAKAWPEHPVIFKPRTSSLESTLHRRHGEMEDIIRRMSKETKNLVVSLQPASRLLRDCGCAMTVSSTAALESMVMGISTRIITDLGLNESLGNHYFVSSGAVASFDQIIRDPFTVSHHNEWLQRAGWIPDGGEMFISALAAKLAEPPALRQRSRYGTSGWGSETWREFALAHGGRRMLSSGGALSSRKKRHHGIRIARRIREKLVGLWGVEQWIKG
jgi:hypothetical protein